jgi:hypothetical protein
MNEPVFFHGHGFEVTARMLKTPRRTFLLDRIECVSVTRPLLLLIGAPAIALAGVVLAFRRYLFAGEIAFSLIAVAAALSIAFSVGVLRVHSLALRGDAETQTFGAVWQLRTIRRAVEQAILFRNHQEDET